MKWSEVIRILKKHGFIVQRYGKGSHILMTHPAKGISVWVLSHSADAGRTGERALREAGIK